MAEVQTQASGQPHGLSPLNRVLRVLPPKAQWALLSGLVVLIALVCYASLSGGSATVNLICRSGLRSADIEVSMDGKSIYTDHMAAGSHVSSDPKKLFGLLSKTQTLSQSIVVPVGDHLVRVHLSSAAEEFDQTTQRQLRFTPGGTGTLLVTAERGSLSVAFRAAANAPSDNSGSYSVLFRSIVVMVCGSAVSAAIGFLVTEFLRSKKPA